MGFFSGLIKSLAGPVLGGIATAVGGPIAGAAAGWLGKKIIGEPKPQDPGFMGPPEPNTLPEVNVQPPGIDWSGMGQSVASAYGATQMNQANIDNQWQMAEFNAQQAAQQRDWSSQQFARSMDFNRNQADINREFQERMSNTQYQRAVGDMQAAGINPMLAISKGGAGTPTGATASVGAPGGSSASGPGLARIEDRIAPMINTAFRALELSNKAAEGDKIEAETRESQSRVSVNQQLVNKTMQDIEESKSRVHTQESLRDLQEAQRELAYAQAGSARQRTALEKAQTLLAKLEGEKQQIIKKPYEWANDLLDWGTGWSAQSKNPAVMDRGRKGYPSVPHLF